MDLSKLDSAVQYFCHKGLAESTHKTYQSAIKKFGTFCSCFNVISPFPVSEPILCYFATYLASQGLAPGTVKVYLAGIRHTQITLGLPEPREFSSLPRLRLVQEGIRRTHTQRASGPQRIRLPITPAILEKLRTHWQAYQNFDHTMLWATAATCFFGFFRAGEITIPTAGSFVQEHHLAWGDVAADSEKRPSIIRVHLKKSKTDQIGKGVDVYLGRTGSSICPVEAVVAYVAVRGDSPGCFFRFEDQSPLTKSRFVARVRQALLELGLPYDNFAGHSFRIGAATAAAGAGIEDSVIKKLGRWSSAAFLSYIRTPRHELVQYTSRMGNLR